MDVDPKCPSNSDTSDPTQETYSLNTFQTDDYITSGDIVYLLNKKRAAVMDKLWLNSRPIGCIDCLLCCKLHLPSYVYHSVEKSRGW